MSHRSRVRTPQGVGCAWLRATHITHGRGDRACFPAPIARQLAAKALAPATASVRMFVRAFAWCSKRRTLMLTGAGNSPCHEKNHARFDQFMGAFLPQLAPCFFANLSPLTCVFHRLLGLVV